MAVCPSCGESVPPNARFCEACGAELRPPEAASPPTTAPAACASCGAPAASIAADGYCGQCGMKQPAPGDHREDDLGAVAAVADRGLHHHRNEDAFAILRPTSPFRTAATIRRAWERFLELGDRADSIRAVEPCRQHPAKMWLIDGELMRPVLERPDPGTPWHSMQTQLLRQVWAQNSSLEIAWSRVLAGDAATISGERVAPFFTEVAEGFSIDYPEDFERAEDLRAAGEAELPAIPIGATP